MFKIGILLLFICSVYSLNIDNSRLSARVRTWEEEIDRIKNCGQIVEIDGDIRTKAPWTAAIFLKGKSGFKYLLGGTILSPTVVLSVFGGAYGALPRGAKGRYGLFKPESLRVGAGLLSGNIDDVDEHSQIAEVKYIIPYNRHNARNIHYHLFLLHLKEPLNIDNPYVRAVCIHLDPRSYADKVTPELAQFIDQWPFNFAGYAAGFVTSSSKELTLLEGKSGSREVCDSVFKYYYRNISDSAHVYCGKYKFEKQGQTPCWTYGTAMVVYIDVIQRWMVGGITAIIPSLRKKGGQCKTSSWYFNANFVYGPETEWMIEHIGCGSNAFSCPLGKCIPLSSLCNGIRDCETGDDEEPIFCEATDHCRGRRDGKTHPCGFGQECISPESLCDGVVDCSVDGSDELSEKCFEPEIAAAEVDLGVLSPAIVNCPRIPISEGVNIVCVNSLNVRVDCDKADLGTKATLSCDAFYVSKIRFAKIEMTCGEIGQWEPFRAFACEPECGIINAPEFEPFIYEGTPITSEVLFPWYAGIFRVSSKGVPEFICGGSLIESRAVLTAAHCLIERQNEAYSPQKLRVVLGVNSSDFNVILDSTVSKIFGVSRLWVPPSYDKTNYKSDIALLRLNGSVTYGTNIRPVCYLSSAQPNVPGVGNIGKIAGFGIDETGYISSELKHTDLPVVSDYDCGRIESTPDSFCAGALNKSTVCLGDSGGGLVFPMSKPVTKYVLKGIVSHGKGKPITRQCNPEEYAVFTHVDTFSDWMNIILEEMDVESPNQNELF